MTIMISIRRPTRHIATSLKTYFLLVCDSQLWLRLRLRLWPKRCR